ncbi:hypothetical protein [Haloferula sp. BvORR071]|uniref:hypothetical protein n=1 Tax=Haloferula sp. BvORR071 TaxID=1396141 RepID=UPI002240EB39|nr:hypothetical protein [Haloferula sp. BvORR071]
MDEEIHSRRSWQEIADMYEQLVLRSPNWEPMRALVRRLAAAPTASELERNTSMFALLISNAPTRHWQENVLRVAFLPDSQEFEFVYRHYHGDANITEKRCPVPEAWDTLSRFVRYKFGTLLTEEWSS